MLHLTSPVFKASRVRFPADADGDWRMLRCGQKCAAESRQRFEGQVAKQRRRRAQAPALAPRFFAGARGRPSPRSTGRAASASARNRCGLSLASPGLPSREKTLRASALRSAAREARAFGLRIRARPVFVRRPGPALPLRGKSSPDPRRIPCFRHVECDGARPARRTRLLCPCYSAPGPTSPRFRGASA